jgi:hypothetical protein
MKRKPAKSAESVFRPRSPCIGYVSPTGCFAKEKDGSWWRKRGGGYLFASIYTVVRTARAQSSARFTPVTHTKYELGTILASSSYPIRHYTDGPDVCTDTSMGPMRSSHLYS